MGTEIQFKRIGPQQQGRRLTVVIASRRVRGDRGKLNLSPVPVNQRVEILLGSVAIENVPQAVGFLPAPEDPNAPRCRVEQYSGLAVRQHAGRELFGYAPTGRIQAIEPDLPGTRSARTPEQPQAVA